MDFLAGHLFRLNIITWFPNYVILVRNSVIVAYNKSASNELMTLFVTNFK